MVKAQTKRKGWVDQVENGKNGVRRLFVVALLLLLLAGSMVVLAGR